MLCTIYAHQVGFDTITDILKDVYPNGKLTFANQDEFKIVYLDIKGGFFSSNKRIKIGYRERIKPSYQLLHEDNCPLCSNLNGLLGLVYSLPTENDRIKDLFLQKIQTLNCEFSVIQEQGETKEVKTLIQKLAQKLDAILFVQPNTVISKSSGQHFLDKNLNLIIDGQGHCKIDTLDVAINSVYFDGEQDNLTEDQRARKEKNELILQQKNVQVNRNLPFIASESETEIRSAKEIAQRVAVLAVINLVAFNHIPSENAIEYFKKNNMWDWVTPHEKDFLMQPTDAKKTQETWKCEDIWLLMWALKKVDNLGFPNILCNLDNIPSEHYPVGKDPNEFINSITDVRSKAEILDTNDLYYRFNWACVNARLTNTAIKEVHPSVVYERHYALNWLINYMGQEWDDVSCDT